LEIELGDQYAATRQRFAAAFFTAGGTAMPPAFLFGMDIF